jgi:multidrug efflux system membrane fusion protein
MRIALIVSGFCALALGAVVYLDIVPMPNTAALSQAFALVFPRVAAPAQPAERVPPPPVPVRVVAVRPEPVPILLTGIGSVQAYNTVSVKTRVDGEVTQILFQEGQDVKQGDPLAIVDPRPLQAMLDQQTANMAKDQAMLESAVLDMKRYDDLVLKNFASRQQVDQQHATVDQLRAQLKTDQAQIDYARTQLGFTTIRAPIGGRIGIRQLDQGNFIHAADNATIAVISQLQPISVVFTIAAAALEPTGLTLGQVNAPVVAVGADGRTILDRGVVELVDNQVDPATGTVKLKARFPNTALKLWPGNFVNGRITVATRKDGLTVPGVALRHGPRGDFVWLVRADGTVTARTVTAGQTDSDKVLIDKGLAPGDRVVAEGYYRLDNGSRVQIEAAPARPGG